MLQAKFLLPNSVKERAFCRFCGTCSKSTSRSASLLKKTASKENWNNMIIIRNRSKAWGRTWKDHFSLSFTAQSQPAIRCVQDSVSVVGYPTGHMSFDCGIAALQHHLRELTDFSENHEFSVHTQFSESLQCLNPTGHLVAWYTVACELLVLFFNFL